METKFKLIAVGLAAAVGAAVMLALRMPSRRAQPITISFLGITNGTVGFTNGRWAMYMVTNHTTNSFLYAGPKIELNTGRGWVLEPGVEQTEIGWSSPPTRTWHDATNAWLSPKGSFRVFFREREEPTLWRASLRFVPDPLAGATAFSATNPTITEGLGVEARSRVDRFLHEQYYDCPVPETPK